MTYVGKPYYPVWLDNLALLWLKSLDNETVATVQGCGANAVSQTHLPISLEPLVDATDGGAGYQERTGPECWSTSVIGRLRHRREIPDERTARKNS